MRPIRWLVLLGGLILPVEASPVDDLSSPSPAVRDEAAKKIRDQHLYHRTSAAPWVLLAAGLGQKISARAAIDYLHGYGVALKTDVNQMNVNGQYFFRLDRSWILVCDVNDAIMTGVSVVPEPMAIAVAPPTGFTGFWPQYRIDGKSMGLIYYSNGINCGTPNDGPQEGAYAVPKDVPYLYHDTQ